MKDKEWEEIYKKKEKKLKKGFKVILGVAAAILVTFVLLWGGFVYKTRYKITTVTKDDSPDGNYELVLQAVGEAVWPFGPAKGRVLLKENQTEASRVTITIYDDGSNIREDSWSVTWHPDCAEVILSGDEQEDERIMLYFDGRIERGGENTGIKANDGEQQEDRMYDELTGMEADAQTVQEDFQADRSEGKLPQPYSSYLEGLRQILAEHVDPLGREYSVDPDLDFSGNRFAILDVDQDGSPELVFNYNTSSMGGMCEVVYGYDEENGTWKEEMEEWVHNTYYSNGFVKVSDSHNHGKDPEEKGIWPYTLYQYDEVTDCYQLRYDVGSWDKQANPEDFPAGRDVDGDGVVYCILEDGQSMEDKDARIVDKDEYEKWAEDTLPEWCQLTISYHRMTEESVESIEKAYEQAAAYVPQVEDCMRQSAQEPFGWNYLLYDMNRDGSPELITNVNRGTGRYSENHFYGLTDQDRCEELPLVKLCNGAKRDWVSDFDLFAWDYDKAYQDEAGVIYYEGNDFTREGSYGGYDETGFYYLKDGVVYQDSIRTCSRLTDSEGGEEEVHYYTIPIEYEENEKEITKEQYERIRDSYVEEMTPVNIYQNWVGFSQEELEEGGCPADVIQLRLLESFLGSR